MPVRIALATGVSCCLGLATYAGTRVEVDDRSEPSAEAVAERAALADERASRSLERTAPATPISPTP
ncbi:hypothetical protein E1211_23855, partial [Micromonospora sp. 15K316]